MFRFTIRDVLWLMVVIGLTLGWCVNRVQCRIQAASRDEAWMLCFLEGIKKGNSGEPFRITTPSGKTFNRVEYSPNRPARASD